MLILENEVDDREAIVTSLMRLYDPPPRLILYGKDLVESIHNEKFEQILDLGVRNHLNPLEVVIESLLNIVAEDISERQVTSSPNVVLLNNDINRQAVERLYEILEKDPEILKRIHREWLKRLADFLYGLDSRRISMTSEAVFQTAKEFRISAPSAMRAISSLTH